jgi:predicted tellurium resistance membrane protein TerC
VGMSNELMIMIIAVVIAAGVMIFTSAPISEFVESHPTVKMLALSFLLMIGLTLVAEGFGQHIPKGYVYFAMGFSVFVEMINLRVRESHTKPVSLRDAYKAGKLELHPATVMLTTNPAAKPKPKTKKKSVNKKK